MLDRIWNVPGQALDRSSYHAALSEDTERLTTPMWKLERSQYFHEPDDDPSWQAFVAGDWPQVLSVFESERPAARDEIDKYARQGSELRRLRVVDYPVTPYLLWEMQWFKILAEEGTPIRVLAAGQIRDLEQDAPLPEIVVNEHALYHVRYDDEWRACGARRISDPEIIQQATREIASLWKRAEAFSHYFAREIAHLTPSSP